MSLANLSHEPLAESPADTRAAKSRAIVIGAGFGGLAAAIRLGARGYQVTVVDKLDKPGGRAYVYEDEGFVFDAGPTIVTAPFLIEELWTLCGKKMSDDVELVPMNPYYRIRFDDGSHFDYSGNDEAMKAEVARFNPADVEGYDRFMAASAKLYEIGMDKLLAVSFDSLKTVVKVIPDLLKGQFYRSVHSLVARYFEDPKLRQVFSFHPLLIGGNPFTATAIYALIGQLERTHGVHFAMGGTGAIVRGMVGLIEGQDGELRLGQQVKEITVDAGRATGVELVGGERLAADVVVSNADAAATYRHLVPGHKRKRWTDRKLHRTRYSMSLFVWYFGTNRRYDEVPHHMIMLGSRYKELLKDIFDHKTLAEDFSLYLHRPTATDPSLAPEGCDSFYVLSPVPNLDGDTNWETEAERYRAAIAQALEETVLPGLEASVVTSRQLTPVDFRERLFSFKGAAFSLEPVLWQSAWFRPHNRSEELEGLYLVGAGTHPGAGMPGVISSAKVLDEVVPDP
ncbi:MAG: phytoene desaturase, partial [Pseudomonadota bacterium]